MTEFCLPKTITPTKKAEYENESSSNMSRLVLSGGYLLCSALISHPLYFFYFIFFSPYLLKLLSFLSPLFITTALLLLLALLAVSPAANAADELSDSDSFTRMLFLRAGIAIRAVVEKLRWREHEEGEESRRLVRTVQEEEVEVYRIVFEVSGIPVREEEPSPLGDDCSLETLTRDSGGMARESEELAEEKEIWCETVSYRRDEEEERVIKIAEHGEKVKKPLMSASEKAAANQTSESESETVSRVGSARATEEDVQCQKKKLEIVTSKDGKSWNLESSGSMRKEKEWKRTLACKLFEERHNKTDEGMDSLWEAYEATDPNKLHNKNNSRSRKKETKKKHYAHGTEEDEDEDGEAEAAAAKLCCLQALRFSAGKMNMGMRMGRPGFANISKAFKGTGWFHSPARHHARRSII